MAYSRLGTSCSRLPETSPNQPAVSTSVSASPSKSDATGNSELRKAAKRDRTARRVVTVIVSLVLIAVLFLFVRIQGHVSGSEFAPTHFQQREFSFYEIPLIHVQITPIKRAGATPAAATYVRQKSLITPASGPPQTWHLVTISRGLTGSTPADANLLIDQLNLEYGGNEYWRQWSIDHPQKAKVFWPVIQKLAQRELYILMPPLFELAQTKQSPQMLGDEIDRRLRRQYRELVQDMRAADRPELARQLVEEALKDFPDDAELQGLRAESSVQVQ